MKKYLGILLFSAGFLPLISHAQQQPSILTPVITHCNSGNCFFYNAQGTRLCTNFAKCGAVNTNLRCTGNASCTVIGTGYTCTASGLARCKRIPSFNISQCRFNNSTSRLTCASGVTLSIIRP